jgi:AraC-like DNA-binding protein
MERPMAYKTKDLYQKALDLIEENNLFFITDVISLLGISSQTFYVHFPEDSKESKQIKEALDKKKAVTKVILRKKLHQSNTPTRWLALYKLICTDDERKSLSMQFRDHTTDGEKINKITVELKK